MANPYKRSVTIEHPKTSHKLSKVIRQAEYVSRASGGGKNSDILFYRETKNKIFWMQK